MRSLRFRRTDCNLLTCSLKSKQKWRYKKISMNSHYETSKLFLNFSFAIKIATSEDICLHLQPMRSSSSSFLLVFGYYVNIFSSSFFGKTYNQKCEDGHTTNLLCPLMISRFNHLKDCGHWLSQTILRQHGSIESN